MIFFTNNLLGAGWQSDRIPGILNLIIKHRLSYKCDCSKDIFATTDI